MIELEKRELIGVGKLGNVMFDKGFYAYVGSAMNGLEQRIARHLRKEKKIFWHIDYLLDKGRIVEVIRIESDRKQECGIAKRFAERFEPVPKFGCSDCDCTSHLFFSEEPARFKTWI